MNDNYPILSIIIIGYNTKKDLLKCLQSIKKQSILNQSLIEVIYVDDGSRDQSADLFKNFKLPYVKHLISHRTNKGRSNARNSGLYAARGLWCYFINSNIILKDNTLSHYLNSTKKTKYLGLSGTIEYISIDKKFERYLNNRKRGLHRYYHNQIILPRHFLFSNACVRKDVLISVGGFNDILHGYGGSEFELAVRINEYQINSLGFVNDCSIIRNNHPSLSNHIIRIESFGKNNLKKIFKLINKKYLSNDFTFIYHFSTFTFSFIFIPILKFIRILALFFYFYTPVSLSYILIKSLLGLSLLLGSLENE